LDSLDEKRLLEIAGNDRGAFVATLVSAVDGIEDESAFGGILIRGVALVAAVDEDRADVLLEELEAFLRRGHCLGGGSDGEDREGREGEGGEMERRHERVS